MSKRKFEVQLNSPETKRKRTFDVDWGAASSVRINTVGDLEFWADDNGKPHLVCAIAHGAWLTFRELPQ